MARRADGQLGKRSDSSATRRRTASGRMGRERKDGSASRRTGALSIRFDGVPSCLPGGSLVSLRRIIQQRVRQLLDVCPAACPTARVMDHSVDRSTRTQRLPDSSLVSLQQIVQRRDRYFARRVPCSLPDSPHDVSFGGSLDVWPTACSTVRFDCDNHKIITATLSRRLIQRRVQHAKMACATRCLKGFFIGPRCRV
jgi:hypothetical protein